MTGDEAEVEIRQLGQALIEISKALKGTNNEQAIRIIRCVAILQGLDLSCVGLKEIDILRQQ